VLAPSGAPAAAVSAPAAPTPAPALGGDGGEGKAGERAESEGEEGEEDEEEATTEEEEEEGGEDGDEEDEEGEDGGGTVTRGDVERFRKMALGTATGLAISRTSGLTLASSCAVSPNPRRPLPRRRPHQPATAFPATTIPATAATTGPEAGGFTTACCAGPCCERSAVLWCGGGRCIYAHAYPAACLYEGLGHDCIGVNGSGHRVTRIGDGMVVWGVFVRWASEEGCVAVLKRYISP